MRISDISEKKILVLGYGREGAATYAVLRRRLPKSEIRTTDESPLENAPDFIPLDQAIAWAGPDTVVVKSPGIPQHRQYIKSLQEKGVAFVSATNLFFAERKGRGRLIGITGTKGKSTTSALLFAVLLAAGRPARFVGNVGAPMLNELEAPDDTIFVVELSSYMLEDLQVGPDIAILLNLAEEHMDYHGNVEAYHRAKLRIAQSQTPADTFIYNSSIPNIEDVARTMPAQKRIPFQLSADSLLDSLTLAGKHNKENASAVLVAARELGIADDVIWKAFSEFKPLPHRLEKLEADSDIVYVNDSISTTPLSALAAIDVYEKSLGTIILGGMDRGYDFSQLATRLAGLSGVTALVLPGGERIAAALKAQNAKYAQVGSLEEAASWCRANLKSGQVCLLSPASPSYGFFKNFEERGEAFKKAVASRS
jgi:UDP-N-acetylmuramoyl-L-alanine---L-glutamate ligase